MGIGTIVGMHNFRVFLFQLNEALQFRQDLKILSQESNSNKRLKNYGFHPEVIELKVLKNEQLLVDIDATDSDGYSCYGMEDQAAFKDLKEALSKENLDAALIAINQLSQVVKSEG